MNPTIIAHRALLNGPDKTLENQPSTIDIAISKGFDVEVDVWLIDSNWFLGHDGPQIPTTTQQLLKWSKWAYFHAKNVAALAEILKLSQQPGLHIKCFFHDIEEYTVTSNGIIWCYPGKPLVPGSISVMPERAAVQDGLSGCLGICTDFAELYGIYKEMKARQHASLKLLNVASGDSLIKRGLIDERKCVALYTFYDNWSPTPKFDILLEEASKAFATQNVYGVDRTSDSVLHYTIMQILGFEEYDTKCDYFNEKSEQYQLAIEKVLKKYLPFKIQYRGLIALNTGIIMTGYPSIDLNSTVRKDLEQEFQKQGLHSRKYMNNIVHSTLVRVTDSKNSALPSQLLDFALKYEDTYFGELVVEKFELGHSSWRMQILEIKVVSPSSKHPAI